MTEIELHRPIPLDRATNGEIEVRASAAECAAVAARLLLPAIESLSCRWNITRLPGNLFAARGHLRAAITQECVVSLDPFPQRVEEKFEVRFVPETDLGEEDADELIDEIPYQNAVIDLGEATTEQLALSLDPYPRKPGAVLDPAANDDAGLPFAALRNLQTKTPDPE